MASLGLLCLAIILAGLVAWELWQGGPGGAQPLPAGSDASVPVAATGPAPADSSASWRATALARPLFSPDRRPPADPSAAGALGRPRLAGVIGGPSGRRAVLVPAGGEPPRILAQGERLGPYEIRRIDPNSIELAGPGGLETVGLAYASGQPADAPPGALGNTASPGRPARSAGSGPTPAPAGRAPGAPLPPWMQRPRRRRLAAALLVVLGPVSGCRAPPELLTSADRTTAPAAVSPTPATATAARRGDAEVPSGANPTAPSVAYGTLPAARSVGQGSIPPGGPSDISLNFTDADLRVVVGQVLGTLGQTYTIDPAIQGQTTLRTAQPVSRAEALSLLQAALAENGAALVQTGSSWRVVPAAAAAGAVNLAGGPVGAGTISVPLRYTSSEDLAKVLQPYVGQAGRVIAEPGSNTLIVSGDAETRNALVALIRTFDTDLLAGQSYALFPVEAGGVRDMASALQEALKGSGGLTNQVRVAALERIGAVLVVAAHPAPIDAARRVYGVLDANRRQHARHWYVHNLQHGAANEVAYVLQQAFTPQNVTAQPTPRGGTNGAAMSTGYGGLGGGQGISGGGINGGFAGGGGSTSLAGGVAGGGSAALPSGTLGAGPNGGIPLGGGAAGVQPGGAPAPNPLLGGLDIGGGGGGGGNPDSLRIVPHGQMNALLIYATRSEYSAVLAMLRQLDAMPVQVRIDATIAEVTLTDQLAYGTQFFFRNGGLNAVLSTLNAPAGAIPTVTDALSAGLPGFVMGGPPNGAASAAITALQAVTRVNVLSSPQLMVLQNETARMQVGNLVPYLSQTAQSTIVAGAPVVNSINYQPTGVILQITPRVSSGNTVTLDIAQEVSDVQPVSTTNGIGSPTFLARNFVSRIAVQDGQTVGLAGLIRDTSSANNQGIPWLKDVPFLGVLGGNQNNDRQRTELIVLITPHVMHDQRETQALTQDLQEELPNAALLPAAAGHFQASGSADPGRQIRGKIGLQ